MKDYVLFSPVGGHDPIANDHDGALLHICRTYRPKKVFLYLSHEMIERSREDNRYCATLDKLQELLEYSIEEIKKIERESLIQVQLFDAFYTDFDQILREIHEENPDSELLLNLSSGTPAMKGALNVIATLTPYPMKAIQVATPRGGENPKKEGPNEYDVDLFWECNQDNAPDYVNRCYEVNSAHLLAKIKKESILRLLDAYNYQAAWMLAQDIQEFIPAEALKMLEAAVCRMQLDQSGYTKAMSGLTYQFQPVKTADQRKMFEYLLSLQVKLKQGNYADFLRGLTPVVLDLFECCLKNQLNIDIQQYCERKKNMSYINQSVLELTEVGQKISNCLQQSFQTSTLERKPLSSIHVLYVIEGMSLDSDLVKDLKQMRTIEERVRNIAAHEIVSVTDDWIRTRTGLPAAGIMNLLKRISRKAGIQTKSENWDSYDEMNRTIAEAISK